MGSYTDAHGNDMSRHTATVNAHTRSAAAADIQEGSGTKVVLLPVHCHPART
ncbi:MAG: hypothetical protein IPH09_11685 [bacterium]|nr:hypothetical protein [bacterium]